jgi:hypothetical protein
MGRDEITFGSLPFTVTGDRFSAPCNNNNWLGSRPAAMGNDAEAKLASAEARRLNPKLTMKSFPVHYRGSLWMA